MKHAKLLSEYVSKLFNINNIYSKTHFKTIKAICHGYILYRINVRGKIIIFIAYYKNKTNLNANKNYKEKNR